ncbi:MAG TPA: Zn-dependent alcohol dehydrogenase [Chloroflexota bacterium]|jgi:S-(hydroxymethyl)glutathione dehydrogenase/alcohol dehydrogenase
MLDPDMKAAVLNDYGQSLELEEIQIDPPKPGEVRVRIGATGVCHSDYHVIKGEWKYGLPMILGHEAAGVVETLGEGVTGVKPGDHAILSFRPACGVCRLCSIGRSVLCEGRPGDRFKMHDGTARVHRNGQDILVLARVGSFAEQVVVPAEQVIPVREDVPMDVLALIGCAVTTGVGAVVNAAKVEPGSTVAVIGCGGVGLNVIQGAALVNASRIIAVDLLDNKLEYARQFGATDTVNGSGGDAVEQVRELTGGGVDYAFEVIGNGKTVEQAIQMTRVAGTACIVGMAPQGSTASFDPLLFVNKETKLIGTWYGSARPRLDFPRMIELTMAGKLKVNELISRRYSLDQINEGFERLGRGEVARGVIVF